MKKVLLIIGGLLLLSSFSFAQFDGTGSNSKVEWVKPYVKDNGTYVEGHFRTKRNDYNLDNFNAKGNYNPYTGETGNKTYSSPFNSLYDNGSTSSLYEHDNNSYKLDYDLDTYDFNKKSFDNNYDFNTDEFDKKLFDNNYDFK